MVEKDFYKHLEPLWRLYLPNIADHLCALPGALMEDAQLQHHYRKERVIGRVLRQPASNHVGFTAFYRLWHYTMNHHYYTTDPVEKQAYLNQGFHDEQNEGYVFPPQSGGPHRSIPLFRAVNPNANYDQLYYTEQADFNQWLQHGYANPVVVGYVYPANPAALNNPVNPINGTLGIAQPTVIHVQPQFKATIFFVIDAHGGTPPLRAKLKKVTPTERQLLSSQTAPQRQDLTYEYAPGTYRYIVEMEDDDGYMQETAELTVTI